MCLSIVLEEMIGSILSISISLLMLIYTNLRACMTVAQILCTIAFLSHDDVLTCYIMLLQRKAMLFYATLCNVMLCYIMLRYAILCYVMVMLCNAMFYYVMLFCVM